MADKNTGVNIDEDVLKTDELIRKVMRALDPYNAYIDRSTLVENLLREWNEAHVDTLWDADLDDLDDDELAERVREWREAHGPGDGMGNRLMALARS